METALYPFFYLTARAAESAEEYITDDQLVFIIDGKTPLNAAGGRCNFKQGDVFLLKNKQYISYQETLDKFIKKNAKQFLYFWCPDGWAFSKLSVFIVINNCISFGCMIKGRG
jgi:hypothetical protein